jgi:hypothetical protein
LQKGKENSQIVVNSNNESVDRKAKARERATAWPWSQAVSDSKATARP